MKHLITLIAIFCISVSANASITNNLNKTNFKNSKIKLNKGKKIAKKSPILRNNYCDSFNYGGGGIAYVCFSDIPCQPSFIVNCIAQSGGGSITTTVVYP